MAYICNQIIAAHCNALFQDDNTDENLERSNTHFVHVQLDSGRVVLVENGDDAEEIADFDPGDFPMGSPSEGDANSGNDSPNDEGGRNDDPRDNERFNAEPFQLHLFDNDRLTRFTQDFIKRCNRRRMNKAQRKDMWSLIRDWEFFDPEDMQSYDTLERKLKHALPNPSVHWKVKNLTTGRIYCGRGSKFPEKKFKNKRVYETLCIWTRVKLRDLIRFHAGQHPNANYIDDGIINFKRVHFSFTFDGIPNGKSSPDNLNVMGIQFRGCKQVYIPAVRVARRKETKNLSKFMDYFLQDCLTLGVRVDFFLADAPMRAFIKCLKGHAGRYSCEYCEAEGECIDRKICYPASTMRQPKRSHE